MNPEQRLLSDSQYPRAPEAEGQAVVGSKEVRHVGLDEFLGAVDDIHEIAPDAYERSWLVCLKDYATRDNASGKSLRDTVETYGKFLSAPDLVYNFTKSMQGVEQYADPFFPIGRKKPRNWQPILNRFGTDKAYREAILTQLPFPLASNISDRSGLLELALLLRGEQGPVRILDVGCSLNQNLKRMALVGSGGLLDKLRFGYGPLEVVEAVPPGQWDPYMIDVVQTRSINRLLRTSSVAIGPSLGMDQYNADRDTHFKKRASSNSFYMGELRKRKLKRRFDRINAAQPDKVDFLESRIETWDPEEVGRDFNVVYFSTVKYQLGSMTIDLALRKAAESMSETPENETRLMFRQEFGSNAPDGSFVFDRTRSRWSYNSSLKDLNEPEKGWQNYYNARNGRAKSIVLGPAIGELAVARQYGLTPGITAQAA